MFLREDYLPPELRHHTTSLSSRVADNSYLILLQLIARLDIETKLDEVFGVLYWVIPWCTLIYQSIPFGSGICAKIPEEELETVLCYWRAQ